VFLLTSRLPLLLLTDHRMTSLQPVTGCFTFQIDFWFPDQSLYFWPMENILQFSHRHCHAPDSGVSDTDKAGNHFHI
jgi:hypothetical protein